MSRRNKNSEFNLNLESHISKTLQEISDTIRWKGIFAEYDHCANLLMELLNIKDSIIINDILMNFSNPVYWKDICSEYQWCSSNYASLMALDDANKIVGKSDFDFGLALHMATDVQEADELALLQGVPTLEDREVKLPDSTTRSLRTKRYPIYDQNAQIVGLLGLVKEIFTPVANHQEALNILSEGFLKN